MLLLLLLPQAAPRKEFTAALMAAGVRCTSGVMLACACVCVCVCVCVCACVCARVWGRGMRVLCIRILCWEVVPVCVRVCVMRPCVCACVRACVLCVTVCVRVCHADTGAGVDRCAARRGSCWPVCAGEGGI